MTLELTQLVLHIINSYKAIIQEFLILKNCYVLFQIANSIKFLKFLLHVQTSKLFIKFIIMS